MRLNKSTVIKKSNLIISNQKIIKKNTSLIKAKFTNSLIYLTSENFVQMIITYCRVTLRKDFQNWDFGRFSFNY